MHIRFADVDAEFLKEQVANGYYTSETELVRDLVRQLRRQHDDNITRLRAAVQVGLDDVKAGRLMEGTPEFWADIRKETLSNAGKPPRYHDTLALPHDDFPTYGEDMHDED